MASSSYFPQIIQTKTHIISTDPKMFPKLCLIFFLILVARSFWTNEDLQQQSLPTAGTCRVETICRTPNMSEYKYNGIIRSGYLKVDLKNGSALGFMFFGKVGAALQELRNFPTIIFLGGGPGASSQFGSLREIGPLLLQKVFSPTIEDNKYTWAREANLLFIDQPVGTGISCLAGSNFIPTTMADVAVDFYRALNQLYSEDVNGCFNSKNLNISPSGSLYIFGEGYGGKFASAIAAKILAEKNNGGRITGLKGVGIGGGLNSPFRLMSELGNYGFSMSLLDYQERMRMEKIILSAYFYQQNKEWAKMKADFEKAMNYLYDRTGVSYYDITKDGFEQDLVQYFFSIKSNLQKFGFQKDITFESFSKEVYNKLTADFMQSQVQNVQYILDSKLSLLLYQGQDDAYSNPAGAMRWIEELNYEKGDQFRDKGLQAWKVNGVQFGSIKVAGKLTFVIVNDAGHYVPKDNPEAAYYLFRDWLRVTL